jgi:hypothetical protein
MKTFMRLLTFGSQASAECRRLTGITALGIAGLAGAADAATVTVTNVDDAVSNIGARGTFYWAITNCNAGDTIAFAIPGSGPHYLLVPPGGFPMVYKKHNLLIDGYTQPGSSPNTHSITQANNAVIQVVIDARNGNSRDMNYTAYGTTVVVDPPIDNSTIVNEQGGFGSTERALLGIYRSTNVNVRGIAFLSTFNDPNGDQKGICLAHDYEYDTTVHDRLTYGAGSDAGCHINGCWFGVDPANPTMAGVSAGLMAIAHYRHRDVSGGLRPDLPNVGLIVGVAPGSSNPRAEFNVFAGYGYAMDGENIRTRVSGNFFGVLPDGVTPYNMTELNLNQFQGGQFEFGRYDDTEPIIIGTDGDGVNDAEEGNLFGPLALVVGLPTHHFDFYSTGRKPYIIAGNRFGIAVDGTRWTNSSFTIGSFSLDQGTQLRFGSDFNGVSDAAEGNVVYNNNVFSQLYPTPAGPVRSLFDGMNSSNVKTDAWVSVRGNVFVNNFPPFDPEDTSAANYPSWWNSYVTDNTQTVPTLSTLSTISTLVGTCGYPTNGYTNLVIDAYLPDPEGQTNGALFGQAFFGGSGGWGFVQGKKYLGSFLDNGVYDSDPALGSFSLNISNLGLAHGTKITVAVTYSAFGRPRLTSISHTNNVTTLFWAGDNGGPFSSTTAGGPSSGFGVQRTTSLQGPWTTVYAASNNITMTDSASTAFYRVVSPLSGMTTLCAPPVTLP